MIIRYNKNHHVIEEHAYKPNLQDVPHPNLHRKIFTYGEIPKIAFNMRHVPMECPKDIYITDTTFRDGQQATKPFAVKDIVALYKMLHRLGGPNGIVRQSEFFLYSEKDREAVEKCLELGYDFPQVTSWIRANEKDFELVKQFGIKETGILVSCSDYHIFKKMNLTRGQAMEKYLTIVKKALERGIVPRCHFEDITRADYFGFVVPFAIELMKLSAESGIPIKIRACMAIEYASLRGGTGGMDLSVITEIADYFEHEMGFDIPERTPFVGKNFNVTKAGIHADGMLKDQEIYNIFDTEKILHRPARVVVDSFSGVAGIAFWINSYYSVPAEMHIDKRDDLIIKMKERVDAQYAEGRTTVISDGELDAMFRELDPARHAEFAKFA